MSPCSRLVMDQTPGGRVVPLVGLAGDHVGLPDDGAVVAVEAGVLLGAVNVDVAGTPVLAVRVDGRGAGGAGDLYGAGSARLKRRHDLVCQRAAVDAPAVDAAGDGDHLAVRAGVGALCAHGVELVGELAVAPVGDGLRVQGDGTVVALAEPAGDARGVHRGGLVAAEREGLGGAHIGVEPGQGVMELGAAGEALVAQGDGLRHVCQGLGHVGRGGLGVNVGGQGGV